MGTLATTAVDAGIATITMDDGKANALSVAMMSEISAGLDEAEAAGAVAVLTGRDGIFSGGFDLKTLRAGGDGAAHMLLDGFKLAERMLTFPRPLVIACSGHAVAMASFLLLSADYRIGVDGSYRITANEVAIGLPMPRAAVAICRQRLSVPYFHRVVALAEVFSPAGAVSAGYLDQLAAPGELDKAARAAGELLAGLDPGAHLATKLRIREPALADLRASMEGDAAEWALMGGGAS